MPDCESREIQRFARATAVDGGEPSSDAARISEREGFAAEDAAAAAAAHKAKPKLEGEMTPAEAKAAAKKGGAAAAKKPAAAPAKKEAAKK